MEGAVIGKILGNRYRVLREVGSGGMAWVYLAEDINEGRLVAVKILYPQFSEDLSYVQRFNREAKLASTLSDEHIVRILDYGASRDVYYLVMEYIEGQDLRSIIDERGSLSWPEALQLLDQLAVALQHAHLNHVVHRDIKPQNLMIDSHGVLKVLDFGIARVRTLPSLTQSGFVGSPYYISPEQAMGEEVDIRSDIYSAGVVFYEMLSGRVPYDAASPWSIISQHIASVPPRLAVGGDHSLEVAEALLNRMIAKRPEDRFQTPTALRSAIACVLEGRPLPEPLDVQPLAVPDAVATAEGLYQRAQQAIQEEDWQRAVDLLNQVVKLNPQHAEAPGKLAQAGRQARLAALYAAARRAMEGGRWQEVVDELTEVISVEPKYRDAADLLERARAAEQNIDVAKTVADLYDQGAAHIQAGAWAEAARCLRRVQQLSPGYKQTQSLLAAAERHLRPGPRWLPEWGVTMRRVALILAPAFVLLLFAAGTHFFGPSDAATDPDHPAPPASEGPARDYREAQIAFQAGDWDGAIELLDAVLAGNPGYEDASNLREQAGAKLVLERALDEGEAAHSAERWDEAIDVLNRLRQTDANFHRDEVEDMVCNAYLQRGQTRVADLDLAAGTTSIEAALQDFEMGLAICPHEQTLSVQQDYANGFLLASRAQALDDFDTVIQELMPIVTAEPDYANGNARHILYVVSGKRGDVRQEAGDLSGALSDYEQALAWDQADSLDVSLRHSQVLQKRSAGTPSATKQPTQVPAQPTLKYAAPTLVSPSHEALFHGEYTAIVLSWEPVGVLALDEYYDVTVMHYVGEEERYWGGPVRETQWQVPVEAGLGQAANDRFYWWVTVRQANTTSGQGQLDLALSPPSDTRIFYWSE